MLGVSGLGAAADSGGTLYRRLLAHPIRSSELPPGFTSARTSAVHRIGNVATDHRVIGQVAVFIDGSRASITYFVFPSRRDALGWWKQANSGDPQEGVVKGRPPAGMFPTPVSIASGPVTGTYASGKQVTWRLTGLGFVAARVGVLVVEKASPTSTGPRDARDTLALGRLALRHLRTLEAERR